ncbi:hypothetical protein T484DRAFT_1794445 [Baffinella frigidus]|nr:hypothetical protein T484DRAFT_1794445 [Cryptophyta sp. CCMP2293]|mmetsp:Transcript_20079/g.46545  ORF Transcript_20079/g.46545 Transcript_20079/m.46545 type:complete len:455 (-) Transcript_20079:357-1721(-)
MTVVDEMAGFNDFNDTAWGMTEFEGMCSMPMMAAEGSYPSYTDFTEPKGMVNLEVDHYPNTVELEQHFHEPIGQMEPIQPAFVQPNVWAPELRAGGGEWSPQAPLVVFEHRSAPINQVSPAGYKLKTELGHRMDYQHYHQPLPQQFVAFRPQQEHALWSVPQIPARPPAYMQGPYRMEEETHANTLPLAPTAQHPSMMPTGVYDEEASSAPAHPLPSQHQPVISTHRPVERRRAAKKMTSAEISETFTEASLQQAVRRLAPQRPAANPPSPRVSSSPDRSKRGRVRTHLDFALMHKGAPLPKEILEKGAPTAAPLSPAKPPTPKRRKIAAPQPPAALSAAAAPGAAAAAAPASVRQALGGASPASSSMLLSTCKFVSKRTCVECPDVPRVATHKRGYLACACSQGHQWVWCAKCCACPRPAGSKTRGCNNAAHWFERDAFDTGRRNHMNRHQEK